MPGRAAAWADAVAAVASLGRALGVEVTVRADAHAPFHPGRCAALHVGDRLLGHAGELHPRVVAGVRAAAAHAARRSSRSTCCSTRRRRSSRRRSVSAYPPATIDIAVAVPRDVPSGDGRGGAADGAGELLEALRLFDVYVGDQVGEGRKSLAFTLRLRARDRTLTADEATGRARLRS